MEANSACKDHEHHYAGGRHTAADSLKALPSVLLNSVHPRWLLTCWHPLQVLEYCYKHVDSQKELAGLDDAARGKKEQDLAAWDTVRPLGPTPWALLSLWCTLGTARPCHLLHLCMAREELAACLAICLDALCLHRETKLTLLRAVKPCCLLSKTETCYVLDHGPWSPPGTLSAWSLYNMAKLVLRHLAASAW